MPRPRLRPCNALGGRSPLTGARVGTRHRWPDGWGQGACLYCHHTLAQVRGERVVAEDAPSLPAAGAAVPRRRCADLLAWRRRAGARGIATRRQERTSWSRAAGI